MALFGKSDPPSPQQQQVPQAQAGGEMPAHTSARLAEMVGQGGRPRLFTSDLSVAEFMAVKKAGFEPLGLVIGSSIYHIGFQSAQYKQNMELTTLSQAMYHARELAMYRMEYEAHVLGADGIVGVRLEIGRYEWGEALAEFIAVGTAVKSRDGQSYRTPEGKPFTSDLSGQDFYLLRSMGYRPVSLVMGSCVYHVAHLSFRQALQTMGQNMEMGNFTQALYDSRELAMQRMQHEAMRVGAEGVVGVTVHERSHGWGSHVIEYFSVGTAIVAAPPVVDDLKAVPTPVLSLSVNG
jgi:uncharacterized protein YbjQ (UPF0145 family)